MKPRVTPESIRRLPVPPASLSRLSRIVAEGEIDVREVTRLIELDPSLTAHVLRWANSAWSSGHRAIGTVRQAVIRLGTATIFQLAAGRLVRGGMSGAFPHFGLQARELWHHSIAAALVAERIARRSPVPIPGVAFTAALVHDIGKLVLHPSVTPEEAEAIARALTGPDAEYLAVESRVLGVNHAEAGVEVGRYWKFPDSILRAVAGHHDPDRSPDPVVDAVHLANTAAKLMGVGLGREQLFLRASPDACARLRVTAHMLESLCADAAGDLEQAVAQWEGS